MAAAMYAIYMAFVVLVLLKAPSIAETEFDSENWKNTAPDWTHDSIRLRMIDDLLDRHQLLGKSRDEIIDLLGEPDDTDYFSDYEMVWWLGPERSFMAIDSEWLLIDLNEREQAVEVRLGND